jgi:hypothetical protein
MDMRRMGLSTETAVKLAAFMKVPLEHLMHMPQHVVIQKLTEMAMADAAQSASEGEEEEEEPSKKNSEKS